MAICGVTSPNTPEWAKTYEACSSPEPELPEPPAIVAVEHAPEMVDLAGVIGVVGHHRRDQPTGRLLLAPIGEARAVELVVVVKLADVVDERLMNPLEPRQHVAHLRFALTPRLDFARAEGQPALTEGVIGIHDLAGADVNRDRLDRPRHPIGQLVPGGVRHRSEVRQERLALVVRFDPDAAERLIE